MKHIAICLLSFTCLLGLAQSDQWTNSGIKAGNIETGYVRAPVAITQNTNTSTITALNSVACPGGDDSYLRRFDLDGEFGITSPLTIDSVDFGIEAFGTITALTLTVNLYTIPSGAALEFANMTLIGTAPFAANSGQAGTIVNAPVAGMVADPVANDLVVEIFAPDNTAGGTFFIGSNNLGQSGPSYIAASFCGSDEPDDLAGLGFPGMHTIMVVNGDVEDCMVTSITANNSQVVISGTCPAGLDVWCQSPDTGDVMIATGVVVDGSTAISLPSFTPDAVYYTTRPGESGIGNAIDGVVSNRTVPTLGEWGLLAFITLLMGSALVFMKKNRTAQV